jgi:4-diphosphocytidyl-2-C-methyl-D-erythritol kinase
VIVVESPAKLNLALHVSPPRPDGLHPVESLVQTIEWCDQLEMDLAQEGRDEILFDGADLDPEDNLVSRALIALRSETEDPAKLIPPLRVLVRKEIPMQAGLGGGSSNAAAALLGAGTLAGTDDRGAVTVAPGIGADVPLFLTGGTLHLTGIGDVVESVPALGGFAVAVVVPDFGLPTADVYRRWDTLEGPTGDEPDPRRVPPSLREGIPLRNDLLPAALDLEPRLGDFMADLRVAWNAPVFLTGSGTACFAYFPDLGEAEDAALSVAGLSRESRGVGLRAMGVRVA